MNTPYDNKAFSKKVELIALMYIQLRAITFDEATDHWNLRSLASTVVEIEKIVAKELGISL